MVVQIAIQKTQKIPDMAKIQWCVRSTRIKSYRNNPKRFAGKPTIRGTRREAGYLRILRLLLMPVVESRGNRIAIWPVNGVYWNIRRRTIMD